MSAAHARLAAAEAAATAARAHLDMTLADTRRRLAPERLAADGRDGLRQITARAGAGAAAHVRDRPLLYGGIGAALALLIFGRPLAAAIRSLQNSRHPPPAPPYPGDRPTDPAPSKGTPK